MRTTSMRFIVLISATTAACAGSDDGTPRDVRRDVADAEEEARPDAGPCGPTGECDDGTCCPIGCVDLITDPDNCGECRNRCAIGEICERGRCGNPECNPPCGSSMLCCGGGCVDHLNDEQNCGYCDEVCQDGVQCVSGICLCGTRICPMDQQCCGGACVNLDTDPSNCGRCGNSCGGLPCRGGRCACGSTECPTGWTCCDGEACFDLSSDMNRCGNCLTRCDPTRSTACRDGQCVCGSEPQCTSASMTYPWCRADVIVPARRCCAGRCTSVDRNNCERCAHRCSSGQECEAYAGLFDCQYRCATP